MDSLSIGASIIAVVGATRKAIKGIRRLKALQDAPQELDDLLTEISQFELILQAIQRTCKDPESDLERLLEMARRVLVDFESLIEYKLTQAGTSTEVDRWQWTHSSKDVDRLRGQLRNVTANLVALIGVDTRYGGPLFCTLMIKRVLSIANFPQKYIPASNIPCHNPGALRPATT